MLPKADLPARVVSTLHKAARSAHHSAPQRTDSEFLGKPAKACLMMLTHRQHGTGSNLTMVPRWVLKFFIDIAKMAQPRHHCLACPGAPPVLGDTDATGKEDDGQPKIYRSFAVRGRHDTIRGAFLVPKEVVKTQEQRMKQIAVAELIAAPLSAVDRVARETFGVADIMWS